MHANDEIRESKSNGNNNGHAGIFISKQTLDMVLRQKTRHVADMIALLNFYYYTALWQNTNQPCASLTYVAKGLKWGRDKVRAVRSLLLKLRLIEHVRTVDSQTGKVVGWYIRLSYFHPTDSPEGGFHQRVDSKATNALRSVSTNALRSVTLKGKGRRFSHKSSENGAILFVPKVPYPKTEEEMYSTLEEHGVSHNDDYDGNFFEQMEASNWTTKGGEPVFDWIATYKARFEVTMPR